MYPFVCIYGSLCHCIIGRLHATRKIINATKKETLYILESLHYILFICARTHTHAHTRTMCTFFDNVAAQRNVASPADMWLLIYTKAQYGCAVGHTITFARIFYALSNRYSRELASWIVNYHIASFAMKMGSRRYYIPQSAPIHARKHTS